MSQQLELLLDIQDGEFDVDFKALAWLLIRDKIEWAKDERLELLAERLDLQIRGERVLLLCFDITEEIKYPEVLQLSSRLKQLESVRTGFYKRRLSLNSKR